MKVYELAKELDIKALDLLKKVAPLKLKAKNHMAGLTDEEVIKIKAFLDESEAPKKKKVVRRKKSAKKKVGRRLVVRRKKDEEVKEEPAEEEVVAEPVVAAKDKKVAASSQDKKEEAVETSPPPEEVKEQAVEKEELKVEKKETPAVVAATEETAKAVEAKDGSKEEKKEAKVPEEKKEKKKFSFIKLAARSILPDTKPFVVEEAPAEEKMDHEEYTKGVTRMSQDEDTSKFLLKKSDHDPMADYLKQLEKAKRTKNAQAFAKSKIEHGNPFRSKDYMRRERVYRAGKRKPLSQNFKKVQSTELAAHKKVVEMGQDITLAKLADQLRIKFRQLVKKVKDLGLEAPEGMYDLKEWSFDFETAQLIASEYEYSVKCVDITELDLLNEVRSLSDGFELKERPAVITIMGHIDHGKTTLLDLLRRARVAQGESGGITQHVGAYQVEVEDAIQNLKLANLDKKELKKALKAEKSKPKTKAKGKGKSKKSTEPKKLTFLDTPGHAAFSEMRSRGAQVTDIVILIVAANDGLMPQTREAYEHAKAAGVPVIVAVNKCDLPEANPEKVKQQLGEIGLVPEDWGGDTIMCNISAATGEGVDKLLEMLQLQAELLELQARHEGPAEAVVVEARLDKGSGPLASILITQGALSCGDFVAAGRYYGKIRRMTNDKKVALNSAPPSTPVEIIGLDGVPEAGDNVNVFLDDKQARKLAEIRELKFKSGELDPGVAKMASADDILSMMAAEELKVVPVVVRTDVKGSAEAIEQALMKLPQEKIKLKVISCSVGAISESDVLLASASGAFLFGFNVRPDNMAMAAAERKSVAIKSYSVIYELIDEVRQLLTGMLAPKIEENFLGRAEVRNVFAIKKSGTIAGCFVTKGKVLRGSSLRLLRDGRVIYTGKLSSLKRFKDDAKDVAEGYECGMTVEDYNDIKEGDQLEFFELIEKAASLSDTEERTEARI